MPLEERSISRIFFVPDTSRLSSMFLRRPRAGLQCSSEIEGLATASPIGTTARTGVTCPESGVWQVVRTCSPMAPVASTHSARRSSSKVLQSDRLLESTVFWSAFAVVRLHDLRCPIPLVIPPIRHPHRATANTDRCTACHTSFYTSDYALPHVSGLGTTDAFGTRSKGMSGLRHLFA